MGRNLIASVFVFGLLVWFIVVFVLWELVAVVMLVAGTSLGSKAS
jgi:hypothetical protein